MKDEMQEVYPKIDTSDVVVFVTPNYWFGPSAKMKLLIDWLLPYTSNKNLEGKKEF
jgi:multimeric flavodoxin WrbA